ncbi:MAG: transglutaminase-like domain-containing protein [Myxococcota bacterium]
MARLLDALSAPSPAIERVALAIAADAYPTLDEGHYLEVLDGFASELRADLAGCSGHTARLATLTDYVYGKLGFSGNTEDYYDPRNSYLNDVLDRRRGIPISLAVLLMALGRRVGLEIDGIGFPGHFIVRFGGEGGVYVDPFNEGRLLATEQLAHMAKHVVPKGAAVPMDPVSPKAMAVRMLFNLQKIHERRGEGARALVVCDRLIDIAPSVPFHRRDRGLHAFSLRAFDVAIDDFEAYLHMAPEAGDRPRIESLLASARDVQTRTLN